MVIQESSVENKGHRLHTERFKLFNKVV
jgi:hypothetical protein